MKPGLEVETEGSLRRKFVSCGGGDSVDNNESGSCMGEVEKPISDKELLRIMECPVCNEFPAPPIFSCEKGHFTCNSCMKLMEACSLCEAPFTRVRNFALESIIESSNFRCRNAQQGCDAVVMGAELEHHVENCMFRPLECTQQDCLRQGLTPDEYYQHMVQSHEVDGCQTVLNSVGTARVVMSQKNNSESYAPYFLKLRKSDVEEGPRTTFAIFTKRHRSFMCWWVACVQPDKLSDYKVILHLDTGNEENLAVRWTLPLQPLWKDFDEIRDTGRCAVLPETHLIPFLYADDTWQLHVEIVKKHMPQSKLMHYYPLLLLVVVGILAVALSFMLDTSMNFFNSMKAANQTCAYNYGAADDDGINQGSDEYIGYRGFYYKTN